MFFVVDVAVATCNKWPKRSTLIYLCHLIFNGPLYDMIYFVHSTMDLIASLSRHIQTYGKLHFISSRSSYIKASEQLQNCRKYLLHHKQQEEVERDLTNSLKKHSLTKYTSTMRLDTTITEEWEDSKLKLCHAPIQIRLLSNNVSPTY